MSFSIKDVITENVQTDWKDLLLEIIEPYAENINNTLSHCVTRILPAKENIFRCFNLFDIKNTKCIIIGQDPYHVPTVADGLAFSTTNNKVPPSLRNIFKEIERSYGVKRTDPNLTDWARQGCLLLNMSLTVTLGDANCHACIWNEFVRAVIIRVVTMTDHDHDIGALSVVMWGNYAQSAIPTKNHNRNRKAEEIIIRENVQILRAGHPSPLNRTNPFVGCGHFEMINEWNIAHGRECIKWVTCGE